MVTEDDIRKVRGRDAPLSIEEYLNLRENMNAEEIEIWNQNGMEFMFWWGQEFDEPFGIKQSEINGWLDGADEDVSSISLKILRALQARKEAEAAGDTHLASKGYIEDSFISMMISKRFEMMDWSDDYSINKDFLFLVRIHLNANSSKYLQSLNSYEWKQTAKFWARVLVICERPLTVRNLARLLGVQPSTVSRWFPEGLPHPTNAEIRMFTALTPWGRPAIDRTEMRPVVDAILSGEAGPLMLRGKPRAQQADDE